jgi:CHASE2 domain-containing sensor protein
MHAIEFSGFDAMSTEHHERSPHPGRRLWRRSSLVTTLMYVGLTLLMLVWGLQENLEVFTPESCELRSVNASSGWLMTHLYPRVLRHTGAGESDRVAVVALESSLGYLQQNVCSARSFTADLLQAIATQKPAVIAVDKYYGGNSCPPGDPNTEKLRTTVAALPMPVVVGQSTHAAEGGGDACLVLNRQLDLGANAHPGLLRLNSDVLRMPLTWPVLAQDGDKEPVKGASNESFALVAASLADPSLAKSDGVQRMLESPQQPYTNVLGTMATTSASDLMCATNPVAAATWSIDCAGAKPPGDLRGRVVVVGAESDTDLQPVLNRDIYGFDLHARYIAALLSHSYMRQISPWFMILLLVLYYGLTELVIPYLHIHHKPPFGLRIRHWTLLWLVGAWVLVVIAGMGIPLLMCRFPPLPLLIGISFILIPRLLIEAWEMVNEHSEEQRREHAA